MGEYPIPPRQALPPRTGANGGRDSEKSAGKDRENAGGEDCDALHSGRRFQVNISPAAPAQPSLPQFQSGVRFAGS